MIISNFFSKMGFIILIEHERSMMRILIIAPSAYLLGGVQDWLYLLTLGLRNKGYDVRIAIPNNIFHNGVVYNDYYNNINAVYFSNRTGTSEGRVRALSELLMNQPSDLILGVNIGDAYEAYKRVFYRLRDTRMVMTLHAIEGDYLGDIGRYYSLLDGIITTNQLSRKIITQLALIEEDRVFYAPYGVKIKSILPEINMDNILSIAWVGRFDDKQKRISDLHRILRGLDQRGIPYILSIAGDGPYKLQLEKELDLWIHENRVRIFGFLDKKEMTAFYAQHNILLITSEWETGPIVAWEAMISGLVIVSSKYIGYASERALINETTALLYPIGSTEEAANQLERLVNPDLRQRLARNGRRIAASRYSLESSLNSWDKAFGIILKRERRIQINKLGSHSAEALSGLESRIGIRMAELLRIFLRRKGYCRDPGSEWPHSLYAHTNQKALLKYAKTLEENT